jgi:hypothetical protein
VLFVAEEDFRRDPGSKLHRRRAGVHWANSVTEVAGAQDSRINLNRYQDETPESFHVSHRCR